jgi:hypothetical protein
MIAGSVFVIRADVLRKVGWGTSITEDWELTLRLYLRGYRVKFTPFLQAPCECPASFRQLATQRMRWAEGHTYIAKRYLSRALRSPRLSLRNKVEFAFLFLFYLQSAFFIIGTAAWLYSELVLRVPMPYLPEALGWALVFTNALSLILVNLTGLFLEGGTRRNWRGLLSAVLLTYLLVPYQAYAALKGLIESKEGGWHRTQKTGVVTEISQSIFSSRLPLRLGTRASNAAAIGIPRNGVPSTPPRLVAFGNGNLVKGDRLPERLGRESAGALTELVTSRFDPEMQIQRTALAGLAGVLSIAPSALAVLALVNPPHEWQGQFSNTTLATLLLTATGAFCYGSVALSHWRIDRAARPIGMNVLASVVVFTGAGLLMRLLGFINLETLGEAFPLVFMSYIGAVSGLVWPFIASYLASHLQGLAFRFD